jgi:hypothetical protein
MAVPSLSTFETLVGEETTDFAALQVSCGKFIDAWLADGGEPTDDEVVDFYGLWSQSLDARCRDESDFYQWAYPIFVGRRDEVRILLERA